MNEHLAGGAVGVLCDITKGIERNVIFFSTTEQENELNLFSQAFSHFWGGA